MSNNDNYSEEEYDDIHLVFDISDFNQIENLMFHNYSIIGIETEKPIVKIDNFIFEGKFENLIVDTAILVHEKKPEVITTKRILKLHRILLGPKN
ncbi:hypothetical protein ABK040_008379 [Willaertia magna]